MIVGRVENRHAIVPVTFFVGRDQRISIDFVVDTGFTDALCLPSGAVDAIQLPYKFDFPATLADGSQVTLPVNEAQIDWNGQRLRVHVLATGNRPLIGTALLDAQELVIQFSEGGMVTVEPL